MATGAAHTHGGESLVAGRVEERHRTVRRSLDGVRTDVLGDAARFAAETTLVLRMLVEQARLAVVDVTHDGHYGRAQ